MSSRRFSTTLFLRWTDDLLLTWAISKQKKTDHSIIIQVHCWQTHISLKLRFFFSYKQLTHHFHGLLIPVWSLSCDALSKSPHSKSIYSQESLLTRVMFILMSKVKAKKWFGSWGQYLTNMPTSWRMCVSSTTKNMCKLNLVNKNAKARIYKNNCNTCLLQLKENNHVYSSQIHTYRYS